MSRILKLSVSAVGAALLILAPMAPRASAAPPQRGAVVVRGFYGGGFYRRGFYGGGFYGGGFYPGWYGGWYGPYWGPRYAGYYGPRAGEVKIDTKIKGNSIYVDGGFAGVTGKLKKFPLRPGNHNIEIRDRSGHAFYQERVHVIPGRTIKIRPDEG